MRSWVGGMGWVGVMNWVEGSELERKKGDLEKKRGDLVWVESGQTELRDVESKVRFV
jgi:hypothetical protein